MIASFRLGASLTAVSEAEFSFADPFQSATQRSNHPFAGIPPVRNTVANWEKRVYLTRPKTVLALECYLNHRIARDMGTELTAKRYRGLAPSPCLILAGKGRKFAMNTKRCINETGEQVDYSACDSLQSHVTKLYRNSGIRGGLVPFGPTPVCQ